MATKLLEVIDLPVSDEIPSMLPAEVVGATVEYEALCKSVGYGSKWDPAAHPLARWLQRNEVPVYPMEAVEAYVTRRAKEEKWARGTIERQPLRTADKDDWSGKAVYDQAIPVEVLRLAAALMQEFKGEVRFQVLHVVEDKDPFLEATHKKSRETFIVAHWDEPGFSIHR